MRTRVRLRFRLYAMILPLVVVVVLVSGVFASLESRIALTRIANGLLTYKAEQLRDYFFSEWDVITKLGLDKEPQYRKAAEESFRSYAYSLLRSPTELIVAFDAKGEPVMRIGSQSAGATGAADGAPPGPVQLAPGWFDMKLLGEARVGVAFKLDPLGWTVAVTEVQSAFFSNVRNIQNVHAWILVVSAVVVTIFLSIFIGHIVRPVERLAGTIGRITSTNDLTQRAEIEFDDEIGALAVRFNSMISALQANRRQLEATIEAEKQARRTAVEREQETLALLGRVSDFRDEETGAHLRRIENLSALFSRLLGQSDEEQDLMRNSAALHDVGKIGIPDALLHKGGKFTQDEYENMKRHTVLGYELLKNARSKYLVEGARIALTHHEKWDGTGYPKGLAGEAIPLAGRIVSVVDVFDALTSVRPYKEAWTPEQALEYIVEYRGKHFDPRLVDVFVANFTAFRDCLKGIDRADDSGTPLINR